VRVLHWDDTCFLQALTAPAQTPSNYSISACLRPHVLWGRADGLRESELESISERAEQIKPKSKFGVFGSKPKGASRFTCIASMSGETITRSVQPPRPV
jgi:hypothetical protein